MSRPTSAGDEAGYVIIVEAIDAFQIPVTKYDEQDVLLGEKVNKHLPVPPLHLLYNIQTAVHNELVHMPRLLWKPRHAITALLRRAKLIFEERIILRADDGKVVRHVSLLRPWSCEKSKMEEGRGEFDVWSSARPPVSLAADHANLGNLDNS